MSKYTVLKLSTTDQYMYTEDCVSIPLPEISASSETSLQPKISDVNVNIK